MTNTKSTQINYKNFLIVFMFLLGQSKASLGVNLFGAANYEECVADEKVGRTNAEILSQMQMCRKKFPILKKIKAGKYGEVKCYEQRGEVWKIKVRDKTINIFEGLDFSVSAKTSDQILFEGQTAEKKGFTRIKIFGSLDINEGDLKMSFIDYKTSKLLESIQKKCIEE